MNVTLRQLGVPSVALTRNFSRSGQLIGLTQPAVSRCITELEAQLGLLLSTTPRARSS
jgi:DNA-binding transcriptional LysR family regulator